MELREEGMGDEKMNSRKGAVVVYCWWLAVVDLWVGYSARVELGNVQESSLESRKTRDQFLYVSPSKGRRKEIPNYCQQEV
jgi:hypothetical protein